MFCLVLFLVVSMLQFILTGFCLKIFKKILKQKGDTSIKQQTEQNDYNRYLKALVASLSTATLHYLVQ